MTDPRTLALHAGRRPDSDTGALITPPHLTTTYAQEGLGQHKGFTYSRSGNPTVAALEERLRDITGGIGAVAFGSGMAAIDAVLRATLSAGDHIVLSDVIYGGTTRLVRTVYERYGIDATLADASDPEAVAEAIGPKTRLVLLESPGNPTLKLADLEGCIQAAHHQDVLVAVDNTFLTPLGQPVLELGADLAIHSTTKLIEGHGTTIGGAVIVRADPDLYEELQHLRKTTGTNQDPFDAWLTLRGIETLALRLETASDTARAIAEAVEDHPAVQQVTYPGLASFPQHDLARRQQSLSGTMLSLELDGGLPAVERLADGLEVVTLAEHLGAAQTLITHPATMTHESLPRQEREALGIGDGLLRLSVGLEAPEDLIEDLIAGLDRAARPEVPADV